MIVSFCLRQTSFLKATAFGLLSGLCLQYAVLTASRILYPKLCRSNSNTRNTNWLLAIGVLLVSNSIFSGFISTSTYVAIFNAIVVIIVSVLGGAVLRGITSDALSSVNSLVSASWLSASEAIAYLVFAVIVGLGLSFSVPEIEPFFVSANVGLFVLAMAIATKNKSMESSKATFKQFLTISSVFLVSMFSFIGSALSARSFLSVANTMSVSKEKVSVDSLAVSLRQPLLQGSFIEVKNRLSAFQRQGDIVCASVAISGNSVGNCDNEMKNSNVAHFKKDLFFGPDQQGQTLGVIEVVFDRSKSINVVKNSVLISLVFFTLLGTFLVGFFLLIARTVNHELGRILSQADNPDEAPSKFLIADFETFSNHIAKNHELKRELSTQSAIARTTQALAHDVRKPFSMFKSIIQIVEATEDPTQVREVLNQTLPEVNQAMASVEGMIQDVMQIGSEARLVREEISPAALLAAGVTDIFRVHSQVDVSITYKLFHTHQIKVDTTRVGRVFANILGNAIQAMGEKGEIWIHTTEQGGFVEFVIGNAGSVIPRENLSRLFDAFFTAGKKDGTGLGLAIAKKIVEAHGGKISCRSEASGVHPMGMVEFVFTLPTAVELDRASKSNLPATSHEVQENLTRLRMAATSMNQIEEGEQELEREVARRLGTSGRSQRKFNLLVVDDEGAYRDGIRALLGRFASLKKHVDLHMATDANGAMELARRVVPDLIIEDVDLGAASANGIEVVRALRAEGFTGHICIHSNR